MSKWRRISLEELPFCKRLIEEADNPDQMWIEIQHEFMSLLETPSETEKLQKIYSFALWCSRSSKSEILELSVWQFFYGIIGQFVIENHKVREDLPERMSSNDFERWLGAVENEFSEETLDNARKAFNAAMHKLK